MRGKFCVQDFATIVRCPKLPFFFLFFTLEGDKGKVSVSLWNPVLAG